MSCPYPPNSVEVVGFSEVNSEVKSVCSRESRALVGGGSKNIRTSEAAPVKSGDRQPEQQTLVVPQRQCLRLVVYLPVQFPLPPTRGTTACPSIVAHITKAGGVLLVRTYPRILFTQVPSREILGI